jgi:hypothetical protein
MRYLLQSIAALAALFFMLAGQVTAAESEVRVFVPDVPDGVIVSNCYRALGSVYGASRFEFCLKQRATYTVRGSGALHCDGRLDWQVEGIFVQAKLRRISCGDGLAWSADSMTCRPSLLLGIIAGLLKEERPLLDNLVCDYTPAPGTGHKKSSFVAHRV